MRTGAADAPPAARLGLAALLDEEVRRLKSQRIVLQRIILCVLALAYGMVCVVLSLVALHLLLGGTTVCFSCITRVPRQFFQHNKRRVVGCATAGWLGEKENHQTSVDALELFARLTARQKAVATTAIQIISLSTTSCNSCGLHTGHQHQMADGLLLQKLLLFFLPSSIPATTSLLPASRRLQRR